MLRRFAAVAVGATLVLAGCSTTVAGEPVADPSAMPKPDTGSFETGPRTIAPMSASAATTAEGIRMAELIALPSDIDGATRYNGKLSAGKLNLNSTFGDGIGTALADMEVGAYVSANATKPGSGSSSDNRQVVTGFFRMKDEASASAAVANPAIMRPGKALAGSAPQAKAPVTVPGYPDAKVYSQRWSASDTVAYAGVLARGRYVLSFYLTVGAESVKKFFDLQTRALEGFQPTPVDKFSTLTNDRDGLLQYTVGGNPQNTTLPARVAQFIGTDVVASAKDFADAGVDLVAHGGNQVYRTRDAAAAKLLGDRFLAEMNGFYSGATESTVKSVPGARCLKFKSHPADADTRSYCVVPVGRYLAETVDAQETRARQAIGAAYLQLQAAK